MRFSKSGCGVFVTLCMLRKAELPQLLCGSPPCEGGQLGQPGHQIATVWESGSLGTSQAMVPHGATMVRHGTTKKHFSCSPSNNSHAKQSVNNNQQNGMASAQSDV